MVAAARLRRAQEAAERARPYAAKLTEMFTAVAAGIEPEAHPLLARRDERRIDLLVLTSDRGLCGGYNSNLLPLRRGLRARAGRGSSGRSRVVGRKGLEYYRRRGASIVAATDSASSPRPRPSWRATWPTDAHRALRPRARPTRSTSSTTGSARRSRRCRARCRLLPVATARRRRARRSTTSSSRERPALLAPLLPRYIEAMITQALLEAVASEHGGPHDRDGECDHERIRNDRPRSPSR